jgi:hypothetical protein
MLNSTLTLLICVSFDEEVQLSQKQITDALGITQGKQNGGSISQADEPTCALKNGPGKSQVRPSRNMSVKFIPREEL